VHFGLSVLFHSHLPLVLQHLLPLYFNLVLGLLPALPATERGLDADRRGILRLDLLRQLRVHAAALAAVDGLDLHRRVLLRGGCDCLLHALFPGGQHGACACHLVAHAVGGHRGSLAARAGASDSAHPRRAAGGGAAARRGRSWLRLRLRLRLPAVHRRAQPFSARRRSDRLAPAEGLSTPPHP
jgi:hypothetical protein